MTTNQLYRILGLSQLVVIAFLCYLVYKHGLFEKQVQEYWENPNFKTDSVKVNVDYDKLPKPVYKNYVPPAIVINYIDSTKTLHTSVVQSGELLKVIDSLKNEITLINDKFLKIAPKNPKLLYGEMSFDSLRLDVLNIDGQIYSNRYHVNYDRFSYQWVDGNIKANPVFRKTKPTFTKGLYLYGGYDPFNMLPLGGAEYRLNYKRFEVSAESWLTPKSLQGRAILSYQIK